MTPQVLMLRLSPSKFELDLYLSEGLKKQRDSVRNIALNSSAIAAINLNFFDKKGRPLGLIISGGKEKQGLLRGNRLLNGVFSLSKGRAQITVEKDFRPLNPKTSLVPDIAIQSGPLLMLNTALAADHLSPRATRRSGIALTVDSSLILFATISRFPGAKLSQIQEMLGDPKLGITSAINLDGGTSSQLFVAKTGKLLSEIYITGGDEVPSALLVRRKTT